MPSRAPHILLTAFDAFGGHAINSSAAVVEALAATSAWRDRLIWRILPTVYADAGRVVRELIRDERPNAVLCLGLCAQSSSILLERLAINLNDDTCGDNAGDRATARPIDPAGPVGYFSTLPLWAMHAALREKGIPVGWSNHAGTYVCNHVFYTARHAIEQLDLHTPCGLVHVPMLSDTISLAMLIGAAEEMLRVIEIERSAVSDQRSARRT
ncbi:MAG: hypothetical protein WBD40_19245 [Tepidisphaeraceae bacterium]